MQLAVLGLNHKTAPVEVRECFAFSEETIHAALKRLGSFEAMRECAVLSTCNRTEIYAVVDDADEAAPDLRAFLAGMAGREAAAGHLYYLADEACIDHLFRVAAGLDSLVIGEGQILSQVKKAYALARDAGTAGTVLNTLFHRAIAVGKRVRTQTRISHSAVSVSYAAVELAKKKLGDLSRSNILLLGAGVMSELTARHLLENGVRTVFVSNRNYARAAALAEKFRGVAVPFEDFLKYAANADIVITSTGAPHYIVRTWDVAHLMPKRGNRPIIFIDIAVPRDVEPEVGAIAGVSLYNIDDLEAVVEANLKLREQEALQAEAIIAGELAELVARFRYLAYRPLLARLRDKGERLRQRVLKRALAKIPDISPEERRVLENMTKTLVRKLLRDPILRLNAAAGTEREQFYREALAALFGLDEINEEAESGIETDHRHPGQ